jgi:hypothetical protein
MISSYLWVAFAVPLLVIFILILLRRWRYTDVLRNKRYWNKQIFEGKYPKISIPSCAQLTGEAETAASTGTGNNAGVGMGLAPM